MSILREGIHSDDRVVWFHASSLGEFEQGRPIMERLHKNHPEYKILLTFFSPSGYEVRKNYEHAGVVCYLPFDTKRAVRRFLDAAHPEIAIFIKYEFWYFFLSRLHKRGARVYSVSSIFRDEQIFFKYKWAAKVLRQFDHFFVQNSHSADLLKGIGITDVTVSGDTRFDRVLDIKKQSSDLPLVKIFKDGKQVFVAGSSWEPDEQIYIPYFEAHPEWKLVIAPHKIEEERLMRLINSLTGRKCVRYTEMKELLDKGDNDSEIRLRDADVLIVDCFGKLSSIYRYGEIALVGGGFGAGIHNVPEAAVYGIPVLFGPNNRKFREAQALKKRGGAFEISDKESFSSIMDYLISDTAKLNQAGKIAGEYINGNAGAAEICYNHIFQSHR